HPRTRPAELDLDPELSWLSLQVLDTGPAEVEFIARYRGPGGRGFLRERSRFAQRDGVWFYVDGTTG
ncbi:MAG TPA: YchJ family metal-binding protein, partial [Propionicimonas sp.]|nr:YchJ family metal-binding protein [Propionicimonas sp.]